MAIFPSTSKRISGVGWWMLYLIVSQAGNHSNKNAIHTCLSFFSVLERCIMLLEEILENIKHFKVLVIWLLNLAAASKIVFTCTLLTSCSCLSRELFITCLQEQNWVQSDKPLISVVSVGQERGKKNTKTNNQVLWVVLLRHILMYRHNVS